MRQSLAGTRSLLSVSAEQTEALGGALARARPPGGDAALVVYLQGDLGAGKTTLTRGFLRACGVAGSVRSPTYTLVETYDIPGHTVVHLDLYRLRDPGELEPLGLRDFARPEHVWLIEWPERGGAGLPPADLRIVLHVVAEGHRIELGAVSTAGTAWLAALAES